MAAKSTTVAGEELAKRISELEKEVKTLRSHHPHSASKMPGKILGCCSVPQLPPREMGPDVSVERAGLILYSMRKWVNGTVLHYSFFDDELWGAEEVQKDIVRSGFRVWEDVGIGVRFEEVSSPENAEVRIAFQRGDGYWSYLGTDILRIGQSERTMNFGYDLTQDSRGVDVPVHEIGHTLGFPHAHQNPFAGIVWNEEEVYGYFGNPPNNWDRDTTYGNILKKIPRDQIEGSEWDANSIMHYAFEEGLIEQPAEYRDGLFPAPGLSDSDIEQVRFFYPTMARTHPRLVPFEAQRISLPPGEQADFTIEPTTSRFYTVQTFGFTDSVMVLFEELDGEFHYIAGDDDSGWERNARIRARLYAGRKYELRIRLYYKWASGDTAVMLW